MILFPGDYRVLSALRTGHQIRFSRAMSDSGGLRACLKNGFAGSTGASPVPSGDSPDGRGATARVKGAAFSQQLLAAVPVGGSSRLRAGAGGPSTLRSKQALAPVASERATEDGRHLFSKQARNLVPAIHHEVTLEVLVIGDMPAARERDVFAGKGSNRFRAPGKLEGGMRGVNGANE